MSYITKGFDSPVHDAQQTFRLLMDAVSRPGKKVELLSILQFGTVSPAATQVLLTLADNVTPLWFGEAFLNDTALLENLRFHCGSPVADSRSQADLALALANELDEFYGFAMGDDSYPDRSTSVIIEVESFHTGTTLIFSGPGIKGETKVKIEGLSDPLIEAIQTGRGCFPHGIDMFFSCENEVIALPRSTQVAMEVKEVKEVKEEKEEKEALCTLQ
ncbi:phosphonate C-P lyase system protein PhnH [Vibrio genomosp. F10]|uniref:phosphonate C-P lyase system protein PhnH n=1 Tax=Vibrio genomosp. F10 TaxID=723171 RepID=UPI00084C40D6|nr:phosphonate C-P lyase system protein PhnH [Vibrio genomosp. F10]OEF06760.1 phosphonate C-P lyase system protein PhnH [Vibrio genomosp. F10 str. 9ZD137]